jgi:hypothetical protein
VHQLVAENLYKNITEQTSMLPAGVEPTISAGERPQTNDALECAVTGIGTKPLYGGLK